MSSNASNSTPVFVSGASGQLGRQVVSLLLDAGQPVIAGTRSPEKIADLVARGAEARAVDFTDADSLAQAFAGVERALIISLDAVGSRLAPQKAAIQAAKAAGVKHLVYTSVISADDPAMALADEHFPTEEAIRAAFDSYTILRNSLYAELVIGAAGPALATGQLVTAREGGAIAWVSREDCARAAAAALTDGFQGGRILNITGPEALTGDEMAALIAELGDGEVAHLSIPPAALVDGLVTQAGLPRFLAEVFVGFDVSAAKGLLGQASGDLEALTGAPGAALREVLTASKGAWAQA